MLLELHNKNYQIDFKSQQLTFLDSRFYTTSEGGFVPSVTTILDAYPKDAAYYAWIKKMGEDADTVRDEAGRRGSVVHNLTERFDQGFKVSLLDDDGHIGYKLMEWEMFSRYVEFRERFPCEIHASELNLVSSRLGFAGTLDRVMTINGRKLLVDIKTSNTIYPTYWLQLSAYVQLWIDAGHEEPDDVAILWLNAKTRTEGKKGAIQGQGWQLVTTEKPWPYYYRIFEHVQELWKAENGAVAPKKMVYQLAHQL